MNILLDPFLIFGLQMGCGGAGAAMTISQWITVVPLLYILNKSIPFNIFKSNKKDTSPKSSELERYIYFTKFHIIYLNIYLYF